MFEAESVARSRGGRHRNMSVLGLFSDYLPCHQRTRTRSLQQAPWGRLRVRTGCGRERMTPLSWVGGELLLGRWGATTGWHRMVACQRNRGPDLSASLCRRIQFPGSCLPPHRGPFSSSSALWKGGKLTSAVHAGASQLWVCSALSSKFPEKEDVPLLPSVCFLSLD